MKNNTDLKESIQDFIAERLNESYTSIAHTEEYKNIADKNATLIGSIIEKTKDEKLMEEYKKTEYDMYEMQLMQAYLRGFKDSNILFNNLIVLE